jgi:hypothetical protein
MDQGEGDRMSFTAAELAEPSVELDERALRNAFRGKSMDENYVELKKLCYAISNTVFTQMEFKLTLQIIDNYHFFCIKDHSNTIICSTGISLSDDTFFITVVGHAREVEDVPVFSVISLDTHKDYLRRGYASLILIFGLSYLKIIYPQYRYSILDDDTPMSSNIKGDVYTNLGYGVRGDVLVQLDIRKKNKIIPGNLDHSGVPPERILYLDNDGGINHLRNFITVANRLLTGKGLLSGGKLTKKNRTKGKKNRTRSKGKKRNRNKNIRKSKKYRKY